MWHRNKSVHKCTIQRCMRRFEAWLSHLSKSPLEYQYRISERIHQLNRQTNSPMHAPWRTDRKWGLTRLTSCGTSFHAPHGLSCQVGQLTYGRSLQGLWSHFIGCAGVPCGPLPVSTHTFTLNHPTSLATRCGGYATAVPRNPLITETLSLRRY